MGRVGQLFARKGTEIKGGTHALPLLPGVMEDDLAEERVVICEAVVTCSPEMVARAVPLVKPIAMHWLTKAVRRQRSQPSSSEQVRRAQRRGGWSSESLPLYCIKGTLPPVLVLSETMHEAQFSVVGAAKSASRSKVLRIAELGAEEAGRERKRA